MDGFGFGDGGGGGGGAPLGAKPCFAFLNSNFCPRGDTCTYSHDREATKDVMAKVDKPCTKFAEGRCTFGSNCRFVHDDAFAPPGGQQQQPQQNNFQPKPCFSLARSGTCEAGDACPYSHDADVLASAPKKPCFAHQNGFCSRGDSCNFSHDGGVGPGGAALPPDGGGFGFGLDAPPDGNGAGNSTFNAYGGGFNGGGGGGGGGGGFGVGEREKRPCYAFQNDGACPRGDECNFSHDLAVIEGAKKPCFAFQNDGACPRGDECNFSHDLAVIEGAKKPCFSFMNTGECHRGDTCSFSHNPNAARTEGGSFGNKKPCNSFAEGNCRFGDRCRFSHGDEGTGAGGAGGFGNMGMDMAAMAGMAGMSGMGAPMVREYGLCCMIRGLYLCSIVVLFHI